ncbi:hypothetical protein TNCT_267761 [Trichonephila clavata]|uniref:Uncharacterized protein n=1 Tax=Trichonephila clavata TaxID=2740835 RepID=A0A8X6HU89_TRICU|nr:hypothetical protein TNCT_267761 [Trichonephila clavata]
MNNSYTSPRRHFTPRNVKGSYQHGKRCQSPTRQRQSRNNQRRSNQTPNQSNNFHHRDVSPEAGKYSNFITTSLNIVDKSADWVFDTATSHHFCRNRDYFDEFYPTTNEEISVAIEGVNTPIEGRESIPFQKPHSGAVLEPVHLKFQPFEPFPDEDSRHERIVKDASDKSSAATPNHLKMKLMKTHQILINQAPKLSTGSGNLFLDQMVAVRMSTITRKDVLKD